MAKQTKPADFRTKTTDELSAQLLDLRSNYGPQRKLLPLHELWIDERV